MLGNGLRAFESGSFGGWGGRAITVTGTRNVFFQAEDTSAQGMIAALSSSPGQAGINKLAHPYPNFFPAAQQDFAARLKWSVTPIYANANHAPVAEIEGPVQVMGTAGEKIRLNGRVADPDGNRLSFKWWQFHVGTYPKEVMIAQPAELKTIVEIPKDAVPGQTIHVVFEATDQGSPALTSYQRVIITVR
jgi:hypothetical protein